jgi:hypothetical protein
MMIAAIAPLLWALGGLVLLALVTEPPAHTDGRSVPIRR